MKAVDPDRILPKLVLVDAPRISPPEAGIGLVNVYGERLTTAILVSFGSFR